jgi:hypothetical protein
MGQESKGKTALMMIKGKRRSFKRIKFNSIIFKKNFKVMKRSITLRNRRRSYPKEEQ